ncbi:MAG: 2-isopropylmalate synthase [Leptospira sp.]|nr:2-isopropylmalate synthase [Leptospira sp.]
MNSYNKYKPFPHFSYPERQWPSKTITSAPIWCSVDLRDGNQSLVEPMSIDEKMEFFEYLVGVGFKTIEVGYPASSEVEFQFVRRLIEEDRIPDDVTIQVLTQSREDLILRTFEALKGAKKSILHFYNSTSIVQRRDVFQKSEEEIIQLAVDAARLIQDIRMNSDFINELGQSKIQVQYSPESFTATEPKFALEICERVAEVIDPGPSDKLIINLPATVEIYTPNVYADVVEWFGNNFSKRKNIILSLHTHNDRGTGIAASELGLLAGADRIEGTILGNGERTGNADLVTLALNLYTQGIDPELDFSDITEAIRIFEKCNKLKVSERHPYAGELVHTAFSGSHQDAIHKGFVARNKLPKESQWEVPYLPIDPRDIGRDYTAVVRINSQSGKGGASFILEKDFGIVMTSEEKRQFGLIVKQYSESVGREVNSWELKRLWNQKSEPLVEQSSN